MVIPNLKLSLICIDKMIYNKIMSKRDQFDKNMRLQNKLSDYVMKSPSLLKKHGESSYVMFVEGDDELNEMNLKIVENIKKEDKNVIMATYTGKKTAPWKFQFAS